MRTKFLFSITIAIILIGIIIIGILFLKAPKLEIISPTQLLITNNPKIEVYGKTDKDNIVKTTVIFRNEEINTVFIKPQNDGFFKKDVELIDRKLLLPQRQQEKVIDGKYTLQIETINTFNKKAIAVRDITLDTTSPFLEIIHPIDGSIVSTEKIGIIGKTEPKTDLKLHIHNKTQNIQVASTGDFSCLCSLQAGENRVKITAIDKIGNQISKELDIFLSEEVIIGEEKVSEEEKRLAEEKRERERLEEEKKKVEEEKRILAAKAAEEMRARLEFERKAKEEEKRRLAEEERRKEEEKKKIVEEKRRKLEEEKRLADEERKREEERKRIAEEKRRKLEEEKRLAEEKRKKLEDEEEMRKILARLEIEKKDSEEEKSKSMSHIATRWKTILDDIKQKNYEKALRVLNEIEKEDNNAFVSFYKGIIHFQKGARITNILNAQEAISEYHKAIKNLNEAYLKRGEFSRIKIEGVPFHEPIKNIHDIRYYIAMSHYKIYVYKKDLGEEDESLIIKHRLKAQDSFNVYFDRFPQDRENDEKYSSYRQIAEKIYNQLMK